MNEFESVLDLANILKQKTIPYSKLKRGDIIVDDHNVWRVDAVYQNNATWHVSDRDGNGRNCPIEKIDEWFVQILDTSILREG